MTNNNPSDIKNMKLSIQVRLDGLSFFIQELNGKEVVYYHNHSFDKKVDAQGLTQELQAFYGQNSRLREDFKKVEVVYVNALFTFVPKAVFQEDHLSDYLKFNTKILATDYIAYDTLDEQETVCVYVPYTNCNNLFFDYYGSFDYHHSMSILAKNAFKTVTLGDSDSHVLINVHRSSFEIIARTNKQLLLANSFDFTTKEDFIYYLLFTLEQLDLDTETIPVDLVGNITKESPLFEIAYTYIRNVEIKNKTVDSIEPKDYLSTILV